MNETNIHHDERKRHRRKRQTIKYIFLILFAAVLLIAVYMLFGGNSSPSSVIVNPANDLKNPTINNIEPEDKEINNTSQLTDTNWNLTLVNKWNPLPDNYKVTLVEVPGGEKVDERIYEPLMDMLEAAKEDNWDQLPIIVSGYRTQEKQQELFDAKIEEFKKQGYSDDAALEQANMWVSVPGYSEHQLGFAVDINGATYDLYFWLQENSYKYGFIFRYPAGKSDITGAAEEVWHYRYVGVEAATEMYEQGLCFEEYLDILENRK